MAYEKELFVAVKLAREAGEVIMSFFEGKNEVHTKSDGTPVTQADIASNELILAGIKREFPDDAIVSEESIRTRGRREWHIDPLDGTAAFILGENTFTVHIGLCEEGLPVLGVVFKPATNEMYYGFKGGQAHKIDSSGKSILRVNDPDLNEMTAVTTFNEKAKRETEVFVKALGIKRLIKMGGTGQKLMALAENKADVFPVVLTQSGTWDFCAPQAVLEAAGGIVEYADGQPISYNGLIKFPKKIIIGKSRKQMTYVREKANHLFS